MAIYCSKCGKQGVIESDPYTLVATSLQDGKQCGIICGIRSPFDETFATSV